MRSDASRLGPRTACTEASAEASAEAPSRSGEKTMTRRNRQRRRPRQRERTASQPARPRATQRRQARRPTRRQAIRINWRANWPTIRFALLFGLGVGVVYWLLRQEAIARAVVVPFTESIATCSGGLISMLGTPIHVSQRVISGAGFTISIENNCNAIFEIGFFLAAVVAYPAAWRGRLWAFLIGPPLLYAVNLLRVIGLFYVGVRYPNLFDEVHLHVAQSLFILCIALLWLAWVRRFGTRPLELARVLG